MQTSKSAASPGPRIKMGRELSALVWPFRTLGQLVKRSGEQVVTSLLPGAVKDGGNRKSQQINTWPEPVFTGRILGLLSWVR